MDALTSRLGTRFLVVTVVPNVLLLAYVGFLLAAGAPTHSPSPARALNVLDKLTSHEIIALVLGVLVISVASHPLQTPLIQLIEGHWRRLPFGSALADRLTERFRVQLRQAQHFLAEVTDPEDRDWETSQAANEAQYRQDWLPERAEELLPTALGNTLQTGEVKAGERYGLQLGEALPRLNPLLSPSSLAELRDRRNQLDAVARLCVASGLATAVGIGLLIRYGPWLFVPVGTYLLCWFCYQAAIAAARGFSTSLAAAVDLHHLQLFDAMQLPRPTNLAEERSRNETLSKLFRDEFLSPKELDELRYVVSSPTDQQPKAISGPAAGRDTA